MRTDDVRNKKGPGQSQPVAKAKDPTLASPRLNLDSIPNHLRRQQPQEQQPTSPRSQINGLQLGANTAVVSPSRDQKESRPSSIGIGRSTGGLSPRSLRTMLTNNSSSSSSSTQQGVTARPTTTTATTTTTASSQQSHLSISPKQANGHTAIIGGGAKANAPPSILHRNKHFTPSTNANTNAAATNNHHHGQQLPLTPPKTATATASYDISPLPVSHNPRVRFMSSGSVASTSEASQVHLMAGAAGSVASSSAMSSADNNRDNVFDRVLHMVMAEEHERLNAMGMSRADPKSDVAKLSAVSSSSAAKKAVVNTTTSSSANAENKVVAALPAPRGPIDVDTGAQIIIDKTLELDTSMDVEYHDINDDGIPEERWTKLNDAALASGMQDLAFHSSSPQGSDSSTSPATHLRRGINNTMKGFPNQQREGKKTKPLDKDLKSNEWVAFDSNTIEGSKRRHAKSDTTRRVNDLASF